MGCWGWCGGWGGGGLLHAVSGKTQINWAETKFEFTMGKKEEGLKRDAPTFGFDRRKGNGH